MIINLKKNVLAVAIMPALMASLIGCDESNTTTEVVDTASTPDAVFNTLTIDASAKTEWTYVDLSQNIAVGINDTWHLAFQRYHVKSNDSVTAGIGEKQMDWYDADGKPMLSAFISGTPATEENELTKSYLDSDIEVITNTFTPAIGNDWYLYNPATHAISANAAVNWFVLHNDGVAASKVWVSQFDGADQTVSFQTIVDGQLGAEETVTFSLSESAQCYDFSASAVVDCTAAEWDYSIEMQGRGYMVRTNGGESGQQSGGAYGPLTLEKSVETNLEHISYYTQQDRTLGIFDEYAPFEYGVNNDHSMYPNLRTFVITTQDETAKTFNVQLSDYYNEAGDSGYVTLHSVEK